MFCDDRDAAHLMQDIATRFATKRQQIQNIPRPKKGRVNDSATKYC